MLTRALRNSLKHPEGQALVLGCVMMLVLTVAVITTVNFGHTIHERVRLQNNADAAAYSMAAMEARAFNFYAFANRTQVSHYVSAMVWQSLDSFLYFVEAFLADTYGFLATLDICGRNPKFPWSTLCPAIMLIPYVGPIVIAIDNFITLFRQMVFGYEQLLRTTDADAVIGRDVIPAHWVLNEVMAGASTAVMESVLADVTQTSAHVIAANDPNIDSRVSQLLTGALSACIFDRAHYREANGSPLAPVRPSTALAPGDILDSSKIARAKRVMGAITNATRFPCDDPNGNCMTGFVTSRKLGDMLPLPAWGKSVRNLINALPSSVADLIDMGKMGQTRFLTTHFTDGTGSGTGRYLNYIRDWRDPAGYGIGELAQADNLASDDLYWLKIGPEGSWLGFTNPFACGHSASDNEYWRCWGDPYRNRADPGQRNDQPYHYMMKTSIWALNPSEGVPGGVHWRVDYQNGCGGPDCDIGVTKTHVCLAPFCFFGMPGLDVYAANTRPMLDGNHDWKGTIPFPHFEPGQYAAACGASGVSGIPSINNAATQAQEFNQPSTWVALNKKPAQLRNPNADATGAGTNAPALLNGPGKLTFDFAGPTTLVLDDSHAEPLGLAFAGGVNAIARGQTYYHRPGNWAEQPNFFNPYWRPRLASIYQGRYSMALANQLSNLLPGTVPQQIVTH